MLRTPRPARLFRACAMSSAFRAAPRSPRKPIVSDRVDRDREGAALRAPASRSRLTGAPLRPASNVSNRRCLARFIGKVAAPARSAPSGSWRGNVACNVAQRCMQRRGTLQMPAHPRVNAANLTRQTGGTRHSCRCRLLRVLMHFPAPQFVSPASARTPRRRRQRAARRINVRSPTRSGTER